MVVSLLLLGRGPNWGYSDMESCSTSEINLNVIGATKAYKFDDNFF